MSVPEQSPVIGRLYDRKQNLLTLIIALACVLLIGMSVNYLRTFLAAVISPLIVGFAGGGLFTILSNAARERVSSRKSDSPQEYTTLSVNWIHAIALTGTFWAPLLFSSFVIQFGYHIAWPIIGALSFALVVTFSAVGNRIHLFSH